MEQVPRQSSPPPKNWLVESILVTIFCCLPFGIVGIVYASQVNSKWVAGDYNGAVQSSQEAAKWTKLGFWIGVGLFALYIVCFFIWGSTVFWFARRHGTLEY